MNSKCTHAHNFKIDEKLAIFGQSIQIKTDYICEFIVLMAKFYIYRSKVQDTVLNSKLFLKELYNRYCIEKEIHKNSMTFKTSWLPYMDIFRGLI